MLRHIPEDSNLQQHCYQNLKMLFNWPHEQRLRLVFCLTNMTTMDVKQIPGTEVRRDFSVGVLSFVQRGVATGQFLI